MEVFTPPPHVEKRPHGRQPKHTFETRLAIGRKVVSKEMTYKQAAAFFQISEGCVGTCVRDFKNASKRQSNREWTKEYKNKMAEYRTEGRIKELKLQIADLYLENQILKKIHHLSQQTKSEDGLVVTSENLEQLQEDTE